MNVCEDLMREVCLRVFKPKTRLNTHQWCGKNVRLDERFTARPGFYDVGYTPYMRGPHEWFSDPYVREITGAKSRQVGGTTYLANCMMYAVGEDPGPILYVTSTLTNAQSFSEREWIPRVDASALISSLKPDDPDDFKKTEQHFKSCTAKFTGSNSPANLMSRAIRYLFEDETDTWPVDNGSEAPSIEIVEACTLSYAHARKILRISTPTVPTGTIWTYYLRGSQHKYHVPCPHCEHQFELLFEQLDFNRDRCRRPDGEWDLDLVESTTTLKCPSCSEKIPQHQQASMVEAGAWIQTNKNAPREHISWHISALYSPNLSWGQIAKIFLQKHHTPGGLHDFYNHYLGLPFTRESTSVTITDIDKVRDSSPEYLSYDGSVQWKCPAEFKLILMAVDVQQDGFWWAHRGVCLNEDSYLIDYGPATNWDDLMALFDREYLLPSGERIRLYKSLIDSGFIARRISGVYDFCLRSGGKFVPCQGRSPVHGLYQPIRETQFEHKGMLFDAVQLRDDMFKEELYIRRIKERAGSGWFLPRNLGEVYKKQLSNERLGLKKTATGKEVMEWFDEGNNHLGDVEKYLLAGLSLVSAYLKAERETPIEKIEKVEGTGEGDPLIHLPRTPQESVRLRRAAEMLELPD